MKLLVFAVLAGLGLAMANPVEQEYGQGLRKLKISDKVFLEQQRDILRLFKYINQPSYAQDLLDIAKDFSIEANTEAYTNPSAVKEFLRLYKRGLLPRDEIFSIFYQPQLDQVKALFRLFYYARDFTTLFKTAVWARNNLNQGLFLYAFSTALKQRPDTYTYVLPPIYEIYPYYFFPSEVIQQAQLYKQTYKEGQPPLIIYANYSGYYLNLNPEQSLSYYLEDIGVNSFYYYCNIYYPFWLDGEEFGLKNDRRGEQYYYLYQQLLARYYMERLSNGFGEIEFFNWDLPFKNGYYPSLRYPNGLEFPSRPNFARLSEYFYNYGQSWTGKSRYGYAPSRVQEYERRILSTIDSGFVLTRKGTKIDLFESDKIDVLGNIVEANPDSPNPRFYGPWQIYARHLLGYSTQPLDKYKVVPSALEHYETALRDPAFYQLYKRILLYFLQYKAYLPPYSENELHFPGVKVEKIDFDRLITYCDYFDSDLSGALSVSPAEYEKSTFSVKVRQQRLNHKPFTYRVTVNSDKAQDAVVRIYLGPKYDEYNRLITLNENRLNFVELDVFTYKLNAGENVIERNSRQAYWYIPDRTSYKDLYKRVMGALNDGKEFQLDSSEAFYGFPNRFLLPLGKPEGQTFQIYVIVNAYQQPASQKDIKQPYYFHRAGTGMNYIDSYAFGYPFDRVIDDFEFNVPNARFQDVTIYHKELDDLNVTQ